MKKYVSFVVAIMLIITSVFLCPMDLNAEEGTDTEIIAYDRLFIGVGDAYTFDIQLEVDYYYITTVNSNIVSVTIANGVYTIHGVSSGTTSILINYVKDGAFNSKLCTIDVFENYANNLQNAYGAEAFYLYAAPRNALVHGNISGMIPQVSTWQASYDLHSQWQLTYAGDGYYYISLYAMNVFLKYENDQLKLHTPFSEEVQEWRILINHEGYYVFVPVTVEHTNKALSTTGTSLYIGDYYSGLNAKRWRVIQKTFYLDNYYDSSFGLNQTVILNANEFVKYAFSGTGFSLDFNQSVVYTNERLADQCTHDNDEPCNALCGESCSNHHKNWNLMMEDLWRNVVRLPNHISVLWADRSPLAYCNNHGHNSGYSEEDGFTVGVQPMVETEAGNQLYETRLPVLGILTISELASRDLSSQQIQAVASISLAHETAHALYMYEAYEIYSNHTPDNCDCIMNYIDYDNIAELYEGIINYEIDPFCDDCMDYLIEQAYTILYVAYGYESINRRESFTGGN